MTDDPYKELFSERTCAQLMPASTANEFFEALFGDPEEGSFDLQLAYRSSNPREMHFEILLEERPGHCLACNLTYGLPQVFSRHPVININGLVEKIGAILGDRGSVGKWKLGATSERTQSLHAIPLVITLN
jgi:hypothetical protein